MRLLALLLGLCVFGSSVMADSWTTPADAKARVSSHAAPAILYDPGLSIEEYNHRLASRDPQQHLLVEIVMPRSEISLQKIIDRPVKFAWQGQVFEGRVSAMFLPGDIGDQQTVRLLAQIDNRQQSGKWLLQDGATGRLAIQR